jgi:hypothetical protein
MNVYFSKLEKGTIFVAKNNCNVLMNNNKLSWSHLIDLLYIRPDICLFEVSGIRPDNKSGIRPDTGSSKRPDIRLTGYPVHP